jgi:DNA ligase (NAD+)
MKALISTLNSASSLYYNTGTSPYSDQQFDAMMEELKVMEQITGVQLSNSPLRNVGAPVLDSIKKINYTNYRPMLSLEKVHTDKEIDDFANNKEIVGMIKLDGLSIRLIYEKGELVLAHTRGNGYTGSDITEHVKYFTNIPLTLPLKKDIIVDGEAIIKLNDFEEINKNNEFKNPRNTAAGTLNLLDTNEVSKRRLSFIAWDAIFEDNDISFLYTLCSLSFLGFEVVYHTIERNNQAILDKAKELNMPCDGVVWKYNDLNYGESTGRTSHHFLNAVAWKPKDDTRWTNLWDIDWTMGRTGILTPVAIFEPVELEGSIVERASLHNLTIMEELLGTPWFNQDIEIYKANQIIPQVKSSVKQDGLCNEEIIKIPNVCPCCGSSLIRVTENSSTVLKCENRDCSGQLINQLDHFCGKKGLDIRGLSKATLEKLIDWGWVNTIEDIFNLSKYEIDWIGKPGFGLKSVQNILAAIENSKTCDLDKFICSLGIPLIGATAAKDLAKKFISWAEFYNAITTEFNFTTLPNFGEETYQSLTNFNYTLANNLVNNYLTIVNYKEQNIEKTLDNLSIVITGKLVKFKNRNELKTKIEQAGGKVIDAISSKTAYLINNDINSTSSKNTAAKKLNIPILTEEDFIKKFLDF